jgi:hypothetical protein
MRSKIFDFSKISRSKIFDVEKFRKFRPEKNISDFFLQLDFFFNGFFNFWTFFHVEITCGGAGAGYTTPFCHPRAAQPHDTLDALDGAARSITTMEYGNTSYTIPKTVFFFNENFPNGFPCLLEGS